MKAASQVLLIWISLQILANWPSIFKVELLL